MCPTPICYAKIIPRVLVHEVMQISIVNRSTFVKPQELSYMKRDGVLINVARGPIVDEITLWRMLQGEQIGREFQGSPM